jgi:hypothetical protein
MRVGLDSSTDSINVIPRITLSKHDFFIVISSPEPMAISHFVLKGKETGEL